MQKIKIGIVGGTGYTGIELLRLLVSHPQVDIKAITSRGNNGTNIAEYFPSLRGMLELEFSMPVLENLQGCDVVFFATPNGIAMKMVPELLENGIRVIDLAADFRIADLQVWQEWYKMEHACPETVSEAVYGLPEVRRDEISKARLIANPGCYPTAVQLGILPLLESGVIDAGSIIADCKSGVSGAGRNPQLRTLHCEADENFQAYAASGHRHFAEISSEMKKIAGDDFGLTFVPHLVPMTRGILATIYCKLTDKNADIQQLFEHKYKDEPFVDIMPFGGHPETKSVRGANTCRIALHRPQSGDTVVVLSAIDNLVKGAAGQAVQNMNIMFGIEEKAGLDIVPLTV